MGNYSPLTKRSEKKWSVEQVRVRLGVTLYLESQGRRRRRRKSRKTKPHNVPCASVIKLKNKLLILNDDDAPGRDVSKFRIELAVLLHRSSWLKTTEGIMLLRRSNRRGKSNIDCKLSLEQSTWGLCAHGSRNRLRCWHYSHGLGMKRYVTCYEMNSLCTCNETR